MAITLFLFLTVLFYGTAIQSRVPCVTIVISPSKGYYYSGGEDCCCSGATNPCTMLQSGFSCIQENNNSVLVIKNSVWRLKRSVSLWNLANVSITGEHTSNGHFEIPSLQLVCSSSSYGIIFFNVFNVSVDSLSISDCGSQSAGIFKPYAGAVVFVNSSVISLTHLALLSSNGYGAVLRDLCGLINVTGLFVTNNTAGGLKVTFDRECYRFLTFENINVFGNGLIKPYSQGGGIYAEVNTFGAKIFLNNCMFWSNTAQFGGSLFILLNGNATGNRVVISNSLFSFNQFNKPNITNQYANSRGGGVRIVYNTTRSNNSVTFKSNCRFRSNSAAVGAAFSLVSNHIDSLYGQENIVSMLDIDIVSNYGILGSAIHAEAMGDKENGFTAVLLITSCRIISNHLSMTNDQAIGAGVVYTNGIKLFLYGINIFKKNMGSALCISSTAVHFSDDSVTVFENNTGFNGGAIAVTNLGKMIIHNRASMSFINNSAINKGGAIAVLGYGELNLDTNHYESCFLKYSSGHINAKLSFSHNKAGGIRNSIFMPSLQQCYGGSDNSMVCEWQYADSDCFSEVETLAAYMLNEPAQTVTKVEVFPGYQTKLPFACFDDRRTNVTSVTPFFAEVDGNSMLLDENSIFISDGYCTLYRNIEFTHGYLNIYTLSSRLLHVTLEVTFMDCPPGYKEVRLSKGTKFMKCSCDDFPSVRCDSSKLQASLYDDFCISSIFRASKFHFNHVENESRYLFAICEFAYHLPINSHYYTLSKNVSHVENILCGYWNRTGLFCSECKNNTGINVASWVYGCIECPTTNSGFVKSLFLFISGKLLPIVLFFLVTVLFHVNLTSGSINLYIWFCQSLALSETLVRFQSHFHVNAHIHEKWLMLLFLPLAIWNFSFMEFFFPALCIGRKLRIIHVVILDYLLALFPLLLIAINYTLIDLHYRGFRPVLAVWKPFGRCVRLFRKNWNAQHSIIDVFAAFVLLSYSKFASITFSLLVPNPVYSGDGKVVGFITLADASIQYGSNEHIPYLVLAIAVLVLIIIPPPLLLLLYPLRCFDCIHSHLSTRKRLALMTFVEAFQGCYKDGTNGTKDYRFIGSLYFFIRILSGCTTNFFAWNVEIERLLQVLTLNCVIFIVAYFQPYKKPENNKLDLLILFAFAGVLAFACFYANPNSKYIDSIWLELAFAFFVFTPSLCFTLYILYKIILMIYNLIKSACTCLSLSSVKERMTLLQAAETKVDESLPARLINPTSY